MPAYRMTLAYDGTDFQGWQLQARGGRARTVQGVVEAALARLAGAARVPVAGASRTDTGVHALGQVASFELPRDMPPPILLRALNGLLPPDVRVLEVAPAPPGFHARRSARSKTYRYLLDTGSWQLPTRRRYAGHVPYSLDRAKVAETASLYLGRRDFASLATAGGSVRTTIRTVTRSEAGWEEGTLCYLVAADGFLRRMVRSLVGGLVAVGRGAASLDDLARALEARDRRTWPAPAPACGLTLVGVDYPGLGDGVLR